jgi:E1-E2 ATPase
LSASSAARPTGRAAPQNGDQLKLVSAAARRAKPAIAQKSRTLKLQADRRSGAIFISGTALHAAAKPATLRELLDRLFSITGLRSVRLDPPRGAAWLSFDSEAVGISEALEALAFAMRAPLLPRLPLLHEELLFTVFADRPFAVWRADRALTFWRVEEPHAGRFRLSHPLLRYAPIREKILDDLAGVAGVTRQTASLLRPESIDVFCQPHRITGAVLLEVAEAALDDHAALLTSNEPGVRGALVAINLALSPISDFLFPPLKLANAVLVWLLNAGHVVPAVRGLRERRCNLELLYLCVGACTLLTFHFFAAAVMYAALEGWPALVRRLRAEGRRQFLARYHRRPRRVWMERDGALVETSAAELLPGQVLCLREGDIAPGDGVVLAGRGAVRESWITGAADLAEKQPGDSVFASTELREGELRVRLDSLGQGTSAAKMASWFGEALRRPSPTLKAQSFAEATILPALVLGAAALSRGGLHMTKAVIRPDYFSGPAIAEDLGELLTIIQAAEAGFVITDQSALDRLAKADCWIFDDSVPWKYAARDGVGFAPELRAQGVREVLFLSSQPPIESAQLAQQLGFDVYHSPVISETAKTFISNRQLIGQTVAYFGDCTKRPGISKQADVAITVSNGPHLDTPAAPLALFLPDLARCGALHSLLQARASTVSHAFITSVVPNLAAVGGAIYLDFSVLVSVILTNLGTLASYYRWRRTLQSAQ